MKRKLFRIAPKGTALTASLDSVSYGVEDFMAGPWLLEPGRLGFLVIHPALLCRCFSSIRLHALRAGLLTRHAKVGGLARGTPVFDAVRCTRELS